MDCIKKLKHIGVRIAQDTLRKFQYIAKYYDLSTNGQMICLMHDCI